MAASPSLDNLRIGVCRVIYNAVNLGNTKEGVMFKYEPEFAELTVDKYGSTPVDKVLTGERLLVEVTLAEPSVGNLEEAIAASDTDTGAAGDRLNIGRSAGWSLRTNNSAVLVLHPTAKADSDLTDDITIYRAVPIEAVELSFKVDEQRVFKVTFEALIDETYDDGRRLGHIGLTNVS